MTTTFETAKVGDKVWTFEFGWGEIRSISHLDIYPLLAIFSDNNYMFYKIDGTHLLRGVKHTLYWDEVKIEAPISLYMIWRQKLRRIGELGVSWVIQ